MILYRSMVSNLHHLVLVVGGGSAQSWVLFGKILRDSRFRHYMTSYVGSCIGSNALACSGPSTERNDAR